LQGERRHPHWQIRRLVEPLLEWADGALYAGVALLFLAAAVALCIYAVISFIQHLGNDFPIDVIAFINDLLLVLIILEVVGTVRSYMETGTTSLRPFLYIGIISATRRILAIGAQSTFGEHASETAFRHLMIDLGVNGAVVLALAAALYLFGREQRGNAIERGPDGAAERS
jgi:uncharacterized membrane protein (DUF373 family)